MLLKKEKLYLVEVYELKWYFFREVKSKDILGNLTYRDKFTINHSCYKLVYRQYFKSKSKVNKILNINDCDNLNCFSNLNEAIKNIHTIYEIRNKKEILILKKLHERDKR